MKKQNGYAALSEEIKRGYACGLVADFPNTYKLTGQGEIPKIYFFPKSYVSYRKPRAVSTEQREHAGQMMIERNKEMED